MLSFKPSTTARENEAAAPKIDECFWQPSLRHHFLSKLGINRNNNMYWWYSSKVGINFGDWIGPYIFMKRVGAYPYRVNPRRSPLEISFFTVGSILGHIKKANSAIVWGSGAISQSTRFPEPRHVYSVRGPRTKEIFNQLGYSCPNSFGDPGLVMPRYFQPKFENKKYRLGVIPHFVDYEIAKSLFKDRSNVGIINVRQDPEAVIEDICACDAVISTSLHGVVMAHAYDIPVAWGTLSNRVIGGDFKFTDYFLGAGFDFCPDPIDITRHNTTSFLLDSAQSAPRFENNSLVDKLLESCPF